MHGWVNENLETYYRANKCKHCDGWVNENL